MGSKKTLVLGGGGSAGLAWMTGLLLGLSENGADLATADRFIGTSTGAILAAQLCSGLVIERLFPVQFSRALHPKETLPDANRIDEVTRALSVLLRISDPVERNHRIGELARSASGLDGANHRAVIAEYLFNRGWPEREGLTINAVDAISGTAVLFDRHSDVDMIDALCASCAMPGVSLPLAIDGRLYMDASMRSTDNADFALGARRVVIVSPMAATDWAVPTNLLASQIATLEKAGSRVHLIQPDYRSRVAFGDSPFSPDTREAAAEAGLSQGLSQATDVGAFWSCQP
jgi:NTE family protein